jgi:hypothetical protein
MRSGRLFLCGIFWVLVTWGSGMAEEIIFFEDFNNCKEGTLPAGWWVEGSSQAAIKEGRLRQNAVKGHEGAEYGVSTIWCPMEFSGNLKVEVDAHVVYSPGNKNNINLFFHFSDSGGKSIFETRNARADGNYHKYHSSSLHGYLFTYLANGSPDTARFRFRDCPGFRLVQERFDYECRIGKTYHIVITKTGDHLTQAVDGKVYIDAVDNFATHTKGLIGFRTFATDLWWDNIKLTRLGPEQK